MAKAIAPSVTQSESKIAGLLDQLKAVIRRSGLNDDQLQAIRDSGRLTTEFESLFARLGSIVCNVVRLTIDAVKPFTKPDWMKRLVKGNDPVEPGTYEYTFEGFLRDGEDYLKGDEMVSRAASGGAVTGLQHALYLLGNQRLIPEKFRGVNCLVFAGTEALRVDDFRLMACLSLVGQRWILDWIWLGHDFCRRDLLVRAARVA